MKTDGIRLSVMTACLIFIATASQLFAAGGSTGLARINATEKNRFAGINIFSPAAAMLPVPGSTLFSVLSNLECGIGISGGFVAKETHSFEGRLSLGSNSRAETIFNTQVFYNFYLMRHLGWRGRGLYVGMGVRYWDLYNELTDIHRHNFADELALGYRFNLPKSLYLDLRMNEITTVYTTTSDPHILGGWSSIFGPSLPKAPLLSLDFGIRF
jgi:hypothetical protein